MWAMRTACTVNAVQLGHEHDLPHAARVKTVWQGKVSRSGGEQGPRRSARRPKRRDFAEKRYQRPCLSRDALPKEC